MKVLVELELTGWKGIELEPAKEGEPALGWVTALVPTMSIEDWLLFQLQQQLQARESLAFDNFLAITRVSFPESPDPDYRAGFTKEDFPDE